MASFENPVGKVAPNKKFLTEINEMFGYVLHLTPHSAYLSWGTDFYIFHSTEQKPLCGRWDINCDRSDINDRVNKINLYFQTVSILGWAVGLCD